MLLLVYRAIVCVLLSFLGICFLFSYTYFVSEHWKRKIMSLIFRQAACIFVKGECQKSFDLRLIIVAEFLKIFFYFLLFYFYIFFFVYVFLTKCFFFFYNFLSILIFFFFFFFLLLLFFKFPVFGADERTDSSSTSHKQRSSHTMPCPIT